MICEKKPAQIAAGFFSFLLLVLYGMQTACSSSPLMPSNQQEFLVTSEPEGAEIYVMGNKIGNTPLQVKTSDVFPVTYPRDKESVYGHVILKHSDCEQQIIPISSYKLSKGVKATLKCTIAKEKTNSTEPRIPKTAKERLKELQELKDEGLISSDEYQVIRQSILDLL